MMTIVVLGVWTTAASAARAQAKETISWASGSPTSPEKGWIQGAGTWTRDNTKKPILIAIIMTATKGTDKKIVAGTYDDDNVPKTWQALMTGLAGGEWEVEVALTVQYDDFTEGKAKTTKKKINVPPTEE